MICVAITFTFINKVAAQSKSDCSKVIENSQSLSNSLHLVLPSHLLSKYPLDTYSESNLYEAINGQADIYLNAGFVKLSSQRLKLTADDSKVLEINIYQMNRHLSAFAAYSGQRRENAERLDITPFAYIARNAMFFAHGCFYIEVIGSDESESLISVMKEFAQTFVDQHPVQEEPIAELSIFPNSNLVKDSIVLFPKGAFGFEQFKDVFTANYQIGDDQVTAFISRCTNPSEAVKLSKAYQDYLLEYGGESATHSTSINDGKLIKVLDMFEFIFTHNGYIAGVHLAPTQKAAETLAQDLSEALSEDRK